MLKYRNIKTKGYDSKKEYQRGQELKLLERAGKITDFELQPKYELQRAFTDAHGERHRAITYTADFRYRENGKIIVEDVKSPATMTQVYRIKKKLLLRRYNDFVFREV